jgi:Hairy Orange
MVASTRIQYSIGYSACVQEVDQFMQSFRFDDVTRRRIVQHLCRRVEQASVSGSGSLSESPAVEESTSSVEYEHLRMCSYVSGVADSTTGSEPSTTLISHDVITENQLKCESPTERLLLITSTRSCTGLDLSIGKTCSLTDCESQSSDENDSISVMESVWRPW